MREAFDAIHRNAELKLDQLDAATAIRDLYLPGNWLEALKGDRKGQYSIRQQPMAALLCVAGEVSGADQR